ncbi:MAG TPA: hypothetical protein VH478_26720 [Trebonia sp.]|nr:hypothetical protein [Trebonia sp.]
MIEAGCPVCRESRAHVHHHNPLGMSPQVLIAAALILLLGLVIAAHVAA